MSVSVAFYTLGCKLNFSETSTISRQLVDHGFRKVEFQNAADIYVINTCSVTENADKKCKKVVKEALKYNANAKIIVIGCYAQLKPKEISEIKGVNMVLGANEKFNLISHLSQIKEDESIILNSNIKETNIFVPGFSIGDRTRSFLKVQDGCDYFCSFCTIPLARGSSRSNSIAETVKSAEEVAKTEVKEVVLTGVNIGDFGVNHNETFYQLIQELDKVEGIERFRISSIEPNLLSKEIISFVAQSKKFVPHFHIPLQSGHDDILKMMRRKYDRALYKERIESIKQIMPHCCIGVDVIVGFPGETEEHFLETYHFLNSLDISYLHVFPYSERNNTTAKKLANKVTEKSKAERCIQLRQLSEKKRRHFYSQHIGKTYKVLYEAEHHEGKMHGFTENYIKIETNYDPLLVNEIVDIQLIDFNENGSIMPLEIHTEKLHSHTNLIPHLA